MHTLLILKLDIVRHDGTDNAAEGGMHLQHGNGKRLVRMESTQLVLNIAKWILRGY